MLRVGDKCVVELGADQNSREVVCIINTPATENSFYVVTEISNNKQWAIHKRYVKPYPMKIKIGQYVQSVWGSVFLITAIEKGICGELLYVCQSTKSATYKRYTYSIEELAEVYDNDLDSSF